MICKQIGTRATDSIRFISLAGTTHAYSTEHACTYLFKVGRVRDGTEHAVRVGAGNTVLVLALGTNEHQGRPVGGFQLDKDPGTLYKTS